MLTKNFRRKAFILALANVKDRVTQGVATEYDRMVTYYEKHIKACVAHGITLEVLSIENFLTIEARNGKTFKLFGRTNNEKLEIARRKIRR